MAEQTQPWRDRTLEVPPQDPWADPPASSPADPPAGPPSAAAPPNPFTRGRASVNPAVPKTEPFTATSEPLGTGWPADDDAPQRRPLSWHIAELRRGSEWSSAALLFAFVCWGVWAISSDGADLTTPLLVFTLSLLVAVGLFALSRLLGRLVLEKQLGRVRRTARGAHMVTAVFLVGVGLAHLRQTDWVMQAWGWVAGLFG